MQIFQKRSFYSLLDGKKCFLKNKASEAMKILRDFGYDVNVISGSHLFIAFKVNTVEPISVDTFYSTNAEAIPVEFVLDSAPAKWEEGSVLINKDSGDLFIFSGYLKGRPTCRFRLKDDEFIVTHEEYFNPENVGIPSAAKVSHYDKMLRILGYQRKDGSVVSIRGNSFYFVGYDFNAKTLCAYPCWDTGSDTCNTLYNSGNFFSTEAEAQKAISKIK